MGLQQGGARQILLTALVAFLAALAGVLIGRTLIAPRPAPGAQLHALLHDKLDLDAAQQARLAVIEAGFATQRGALEAQLRTDNAGIAAAIEAEHGDGPQVAAAVDRSHRAMGALQKATLSHIFAMRQILRPDQAVRFDAAITHALTADTR